MSSKDNRKAKYARKRHRKELERQAMRERALKRIAEANSIEAHSKEVEKHARPYLEHALEEVKEG